MLNIIIYTVCLSWIVREMSAGTSSIQGRSVHWLHWRLQTSPHYCQGLRSQWLSGITEALMGICSYHEHTIPPWILVKLPVCFPLVSFSDWSNFRTRWTFQIRYREGSQLPFTSNISSVPSLNSLFQVNDCACVCVSQSSCEEEQRLSKSTSLLESQHHHLLHCLEKTTVGTRQLRRLSSQTKSTVITIEKSLILKMILNVFCPVVLVLLKFSQRLLCIG